jgi:hypothetical protein
MSAEWSEGEQKSFSEPLRFTNEVNYPTDIMSEPEPPEGSVFWSLTVPYKV